jgi:hypothetical protein
MPVAEVLLGAADRTRRTSRDEAMAPPTTRHRSRPSRSLAALGVTILLAGGAGACSSDTDSGDDEGMATTTTADPAVTSALHDAAAAMDDARSYQYTATVVSEGETTTVVGDVVGPDLHAAVLEHDGAVSEVTYIGADTWTKPGGGTWQSTPDAPGPDPDTRALIAALRDATVIGGTPTGVTFALAADSPFLATTEGAQDVSGQANITDGRITRLYYGVSGSVPSQLVTIEITEPGSASIDPPI